jgi:dolichol-phosphate mannosyltransferase
MNTVYLLEKNNYNIKEIPIKFHQRKKGKSKIPKIEIFRTILNLFIIKFKD